MSIYCLLGPDNKLIESTIGETYDDCWGKSFSHVADYFNSHGFKYRGKYHTDFRERFWKKWAPALNCALNNGFDIVECRLHRIPQ